VTVHYDPMIAKVIAHAETRDLARARLMAALRDFAVLGIRTNIPFLLRVLEHDHFAAGTIDTAYLDREGESFSVASPSTPAAVSAAVRAHLAAIGPAAASPADPASPTGWDPWSSFGPRRFP
jgi:acetyl/propionyl-CoA carboxylase alpha subunit